ncbi:MAG TPA: universal stress protein [Anaerolineae bacterium]|nr:universal stress protein [Anaerolineae bacterium]MCB9107194.1 universal stress protein [Anaerolineales bacterium]HRV94680.1 universal stress protein [Anaerolineae bacterium]
MYRTILVPLDGSERAEAIIPHVENLAQHEHAKVVLTQVIEPVSRSFVLDPDAPPKYKFDTSGADTAKAYLARWQKKFELQGINAETLLMWGPTVESIIHAANEAKADLIAVTSQGRSGLAQVFYGSVASGLLNRVRRPLLLVRPNTRPITADNRHILAPMDGSKRSEAILPHVEGVAKLYDAEVTLLRVVVTLNQNVAYDNIEAEFEAKEVHGHLLNRLGESQEVERFSKAREHILVQRNKLRQKGLNVEALLMHGRPVDGIVRTAENIQADLIALTSQGHTGLAQVFYGSVASGIMNQIERPLLLVKPD